MSTSVADLFVILDSVTDPFSKGMEKAAADAEAESGRMTKALKAVTAVGVGLAVGVAAIGVKSIDMATQFQASMETLHTQAGVAQGQIAGLSNGVLSLAGQVGFSPNSLAQALYHIESSFASVGITGAKAMQLLQTAAEGAAVGHADLVDVTNALDAAVASGIPGVQDFSQAMGVLNATVGAGDMTMQDLANAFSTGLLANVKSYGLSITDVGAALATFGDNNIRGQNAATDLRMAVQAMAVPAKSAADELQKMGMSSSTLADVMSKQGLLPALELLKTKMTDVGVTAQNQGEVLTQLFGKKAGAGIVVLYDQLDRLKSKYPDLTKGANNFADAWTQTKATISQQFNEIRSGADALAVRLGEALLPQVSKVISEGQSALGQIESGFSGADLKAPTINFHNASLNDMARQMQQPQTAWERFGQTVHTVLGDVETFGKRLVPIGQNFVTFGIDVWQAGEKIVTAVTPTVALIGTGLFGALELAGKAAANILGPAIKDFANFLEAHQGAVKFFSEVILGGLIAKMAILGAIRAATGIVGLATAIVSFPLGQASQIGDALTGLKTAFAGKEAADGEKAVKGLAGAFTDLKAAGANVLDKILPDSGKLATLSQLGTDASNLETAAAGAATSLPNMAKGMTEAEGAAVEAETATSGLASSIGKFALTGGLIGAAVIGLGLLVTKLASLPSPAQQAAQALSNAAAETQRLASGTAQSVSEDVKGIVGIMESMKVGVATPNMVASLKGVDQQLAQLVSSGHADQAKQLVDQVAASLQKSGYNATLAAQDLPQYEKALQGAGNAAHTADGEVQGLQTTLQKQQAITQFNSDLQNVTQSIQTNGRALTGNSQQALLNQQAFQQAAGDVLNYYQQQRNAGVPIQQATTDMLGQVKQLEATGIQAGLTKGQVDKYLGSLNLLPSQIETTIGANIKPAQYGLATLLNQINSSSGTVTVYQTTSGTVGSTQTKVYARASGGPVERNNTYWVGEHGPELVTFGANGYVTPTEMLKPAALAGTGATGGGVGGGVTNNYFITQVAGSVLTEKKLVDVVRTTVLQYNGRNSGNGWSVPT